MKKLLILTFFISQLAFSSPLVATNLSKFLKIKTISIKKDEFTANEFKRAQNFLKSAYPKIFAKFLIKEINGTMLLHIPSTQSRSILLNAHYDVVNVNDDDLKSWNKAPFSGEISKGYIYGRGAVDDKASVITILEALKTLPASHPNIYVSITHDEEVGGLEGAHLVKKYLQSQNVLIDAVFDEGLVVVNKALSFIKSPLALVGVAEKGYASVKLSTFAHGGHSSMPQKTSAITKMTKTLSEIHSNSFRPNHHQVLRDFLYKVGLKTDGFMGFALRYNHLFSPLILNILSKQPQTDALIRTTMANTIMAAGNQENVIPNFASSVFNFRILPGESIEKTIQTFKTFYPNEDINFELLKGSSNPSKIAPQDHFAYEAIQKANSKIFPKALTVPNIMVAKTDSYHYQDLTQNIYRFLPIELEKEDTSMIHGINERIKLSSLPKMIEFYRKIIKYSSIKDSKVIANQ